jgi:hypothetical protein
MADVDIYDDPPYVRANRDDAIDAYIGNHPDLARRDLALANALDAMDKEPSLERVGWEPGGLAPVDVQALREGRVEDRVYALRESDVYARTGHAARTVNAVTLTQPDEPVPEPPEADMLWYHFWLSEQARMNWRTR